MEFSFDDIKIVFVFLLIVALMYLSCEPSSINKLNKKGGKDGDKDSGTSDVRGNARL